MAFPIGNSAAALVQRSAMRPGLTGHDLAEDHLASGAKEIGKHANPRKHQHLSMPSIASR